MKFLFKLVLILVVLLVGAWFYGRSLERDHIVSSTITLLAPADSVWRVVRDFEAAPSWWPSLKSSTRLIGRPRESWEQDMGRSGIVRFEIRSETPGRRLVTEILNDNQEDFGGTWTYDVVATGAGTEITITENGWVETPLFRVVSKVLGKYRTMDSYLRAMSGLYGEISTPRHGE
jgi:uncharacterized protein YndB with AHSA1/START domain